MTQEERDRLTDRLNIVRPLSDKYKKYYNSAKDAIDSLTKAKNGFNFMVDDQIPAVQKKVTSSIHPNDTLLSDLQVKNTGILTSITTAISRLETERDRFLEKHKTYDSEADSIERKLFWSF